MTLRSLLLVLHNCDVTIIDLNMDETIVEFLDQYRAFFDEDVKPYLNWVVDSITTSFNTVVIYIK